MPIGVLQLAKLRERHYLSIPPKSAANINSALQASWSTTGGIGCPRMGAAIEGGLPDEYGGDGDLSKNLLIACAPFASVEKSAVLRRTPYQRIAADKLDSR
jgi:hypothetical protein